MKTLFISDIHLDSVASPITEGLCQFLDTVAADAQALYLLGDLFESYVGDDEYNRLHQIIAYKLAKLAQQGTQIYLLNGNRDFLVGNLFAQRCQATLLPPSVVINLYGTPTLLMHGDSLCTLDKPYQRMRRLFLNKTFQFFALQLPLSWRLKAATYLRHNSGQMVAHKSFDLMDVTPAAVAAALLENSAHRLIHGHTHRPAVHYFNFGDQQQGERLVLGAWDMASAYYVEATPAAVVLKQFNW